MTLFATLSDLARGCPRNIKRRLLRDILLILFVTTGAILVLVLAYGIQSKRNLSSAIIAKTSQHVASRYHSYTGPLNNVLFLLAKWGESGLLQPEPSKLLATQFQALMELQPRIKAISLADTKKNEIQLFHDNGQWILQRHRKGKTSSSQWVKGEIINVEEQAATGYNPGATAWYRGAMTLPSEQQFFVSEPHPLTATGDMGITASLRWSEGKKEGGETFVSAISLSLKEFMLFFRQLEITASGRVLLLKKNGTLLGNLRTNELATASSSAPAGEKLAAELLQTAHEKLQETQAQGPGITSFRNKGKVWWLGLSPLMADTNDVWLAVLIPEQDIFNDQRRQWLRFGLIAGFILLFACIMTLSLIRRYSHQLKDLPQQHIGTQSYQNEIEALIRAGESTTLEFKSTMRINLKSGKSGKEIELAWLKTVVGFMNSDGGILFIGVADNGEIIGTEADNFANEDKCRLHFKNLLNTHIGAEFTRFIHLKIVSIHEKTILIVECERVRRPVFLKVGSNEDFFIRSGPSSTKLSMSQMVKYLAER